MDVITITSVDGELYKFDPETERIFRDGVLVPSSQAEPVYSDVNGLTKFSGLYLKNTKQILTLSGMKNPVTDSATITI